MTQAFLGDVVSLGVFALLVAGIMKVFQIATDLREIKDVLRDIKRNAQPVAAPPPLQPSAPGPISPEELVRAVHAQNFSDEDFRPMEPMVLPPKL